MPLTLQQAFELYKAARAVAHEKRAARKDAEDRAKAAVDEDRAASTSMDNAFTNLTNHINMLSRPDDSDPRR